MTFTFVLLYVARRPRTYFHDNANGENTFIYYYMSWRRLVTTSNNDDAYLCSTYRWHGTQMARRRVHIVRPKSTRTDDENLHGWCGGAKWRAHYLYNTRQRRITKRWHRTCTDRERRETASTRLVHWPLSAKRNINYLQYTRFISIARIGNY